MEEKDKISIYQNLANSYVSKNAAFFSSADLSFLKESISKGDNKYVRVRRKETSAFDGEWIDEIEKVIPDLEDIVRNPRKITETVGNVVPVELVKKTSSESVIHLATHTQFVKEVKENNDVVPSKILSIENDDFYGIYENRFIATLIRKLLLFVEKRYEYITNHALLKDVEELKVRSKTVIDGSLVEIETKVKVVKPSDYKGIEEANAYKERVLEIRKHLSYCYNSEFMKMMKTEKNVRNPILMTNILRKNPAYHRCYSLYKYIEGYKGVGVSYSVNDKYSSFGSDELDQVNNMLVSNFLTLRADNPSRFATMRPIECKPKILASIDDEEFIYGPYLSGDIEFVRVDEDYRRASETVTEFYREEDAYGKDMDYVPKKERVTAWLKKEDEEYISEERLENRAIRLMKEAKDSLVSRKRKACEAFEKKALVVIKKRNQERRNLEEKQRKEVEQRELSIKDRARKKLVEVAIKEAKEINKDDDKKE